MRRRGLLLLVANYFFLLWLPLGRATLLDGLPALQNRTILDTHLQDLLSRSIGWLEFRADYASDPKLHEYAEILGMLVRPSCINCIEYFEALGVLRSLSKLIKELIDADKDTDVFMPVVRRSYVAAVWTLQRSRLFKWEFTHFQSNALSTMYRLYLHHVKRAKGRTVSFHHISKCGGTTMCQLAATNRCSNPHLNIEKNCVLSDRLDGPIWMVGHDVTDAGAFPNATLGALDVDAPENATLRVFSRRGYASEPRMDMWLMYGCPWNPLGRQYSCSARLVDVQESGTTFLANERTLATEFDIPQVCPEFVNAVILREPVPHAISLMAEVKYRYVRQLVFRHNITAWTPPAWNLTWWETLGPALVGGYSTRTLIGRASFCRSAANMTQQELSEGVFSLLSFDVVATLGRARDIDLMISTMLGWPARNFSSQPASRVRDVAITLATPPPSDGFDNYRRHLLQQQQGGWGADSGSSSSSGWGTGGGSSDDGSSSGWGSGSGSDDDDDDDDGSSSSSSGQQAFGGGGDVLDVEQAVTGGNSAFATASGAGGLRQMLAVGGDSNSNEQQQRDGGSQGDDEADDAGSDDRDEEEQQQQQHPGGGGGGEGFALDGSEASDDDAFAAAVAALEEPFEEVPPPPPIPPEVIAATGAVELVRKSWLERRAGLAGFGSNLTAAAAALGSPVVEHQARKTRHGAHIVTATLVGQGGRPNETEVWHAFPRHAFAFIEADMARLESLTWVDAALVEVADLLLDLDVGLLGSLLDNFHTRRKMKALATTNTACGFAGMMPVEESIQRHVFF